MPTHEFDQTNEPESGLVSRRTLMRTGAHMAWAVPAVLAVSSVPAYAACISGETNPTVTGTFTPSGDTGASSQNWHFAGTLSVNNPTNATVVVTLVVTVTPNTVPAEELKGFHPNAINGGWSLVSTTGTTATYERTFAPCEEWVGNVSILVQQKNKTNGPAYDVSRMVF